MIEKYFLHRIQQENGTFTKGIEVHNTKESAILAFWGRMKLGYNNPNFPGMTFVSCKITDGNGGVVDNYNLTWVKGEPDGVFFMHHIRLEGETFNKDIDICNDFDTARSAFAAAMEYGYGNPLHSNVTFVSCEITDRNGDVMLPFRETWNKPEPEPEAVS